MTILPANLKVLVVGGGGREHALAWKLAESPLVGEVYCAPGNAGTAREPFVTNVDTAPNAAAGDGAAATEGAAAGDGAATTEAVAGPRPFNPRDPQSVLALARRLEVDLTVIGPEDPLAAGVADVFAGAGLALFGPTKAAHRLESSKAFAKDFMARHGIPTARFEVAETPATALTAVARFGAPVVVKADGLAAGKGVVVAADRAEAEAAVRAAMEEGVFGAAGRRVVVEEYLEGQELSIHALTDGETVLTFPPAQDHKRAFNGDRGPNTGGMGAYCPAPLLTPDGERFVADRILGPTLRGIAREAAPYRGVLYVGLMLTRDGPRVLEFNCRFGDPETQVMLPLLEEDLAELMLSVVAGDLGKGAGPRRLRVSGQSAVCVVMASGGYPGRYETGKVIDGLEVAGARAGVKIFHAGTKAEEGATPGRVLTAGGRVLNVVATAPDLASAVEEAYRAVALVRFEGAHYRTDIASRAT